MIPLSLFRCKNCNLLYACNQDGSGPPNERDHKCEACRTKSFDPVTIEPSFDGGWGLFAEES